MSKPRRYRYSLPPTLDVIDVQRQNTKLSTTSTTHPTPTIAARSRLITKASWARQPHIINLHNAIKWLTQCCILGCTDLQPNPMLQYAVADNADGLHWRLNSTHRRDLRASQTLAMKKNSVLWIPTTNPRTFCPANTRFPNKPKLDYSTGLSSRLLARVIYSAFAQNSLLSRSCYSIVTKIKLCRSPKPTYRSWMQPKRFTLST